MRLQRFPFLSAVAWRASWTWGWKYYSTDHPSRNGQFSSLLYAWREFDLESCPVPVSGGAPQRKAQYVDLQSIDSKIFGSANGGRTRIGHPLTFPTSY